MPDGETSGTQQSGIANNIKAINTTVMLLSQKIGYLIRNEKILSQNILVLNDKLKKLDEKFSGSQGIETGANANLEELETLKSQISELYNKISGLKSEIDGLNSSIDSLKSEFVSRKDFQEMKYLIDSINPLEYVTYKQMKDLLKKD